MSGASFPRKGCVDDGLSEQDRLDAPNTVTYFVTPEAPEVGGE